jgi:hypothetical protein
VTTGTLSTHDKKMPDSAAPMEMPHTHEEIISGDTPAAGPPGRR